MNTTAFYNSYTGLARKMLIISQKPAEIEAERERLKQEIKGYVNYLEKFEPFYTRYPALNTELMANVQNLRVGAFIEYQLDMVHAELRNTEALKAEINQEVMVLRTEYAEESAAWLTEEENRIANCYRYLDTSNIAQVIGFLNNRLSLLKDRKESCRQERQLKLDAIKAGQRQADETRRLQAQEEARRRGAELSQAEMEERRKKAQEAYKHQLSRRKKQ